MGYNLGSKIRTKHTYSVDSLRIGACNDGDELEHCRGGYNEYEVGGSFDNGAKCDKMQNVGITIQCSEGDSNKTISCSGKILIFKSNCGGVTF